MEFDTITGKNDTYQYVPLMEALEQMLKHEDVLAEIFRRKRESNYIESFFDGNLYKHHPLFGITPNSLMLNIYDDEFTIGVRQKVTRY